MANCRQILLGQNTKKEASQEGLSLEGLSKSKKSWLRGVFSAEVKKAIFTACGKIDTEGSFPAALWTKLTSLNMEVLSTIKGFPENYVARRNLLGSKRYLMYIYQENVCIMDENCRVSFFKVSFSHPEPLHKQLTNTLIDGRMHYSEKLKKRIFLIHDIIQPNSYHLNLTDRIKIINEKKLGENLLSEELVIQLEPRYPILNTKFVENFVASRNDNHDVIGLLFQNKHDPYKCELRQKWFKFDSDCIGPHILQWRALIKIIENKLRIYNSAIFRLRKRKKDSGEDHKDEPQSKKKKEVKELPQNCAIHINNKKGVAVGWCYHSVCWVCAAKRRAAEKDLTCSECLHVMPVVIYTQKLPSPEKVASMLYGLPDNHKEYIFMDDLSKTNYRDLTGPKCSVLGRCPKRRSLFKNFWELRSHMFKVHNLSPCHLCDEDTTQANFLKHRRWANKQDNKTYLKHLMDHHEMCYYCEFDFRKHNNWFPNQEKLAEHHASHVQEMGESEDNVDCDPHYEYCGWQDWAEEYKIYQNNMITGNTSASKKFIEREDLKYDQAFIHLPDRRTFEVGNFRASQQCHVCSELIRDETTLTDMGSKNSNYMRHLLSKHIMCFFCAFYKDKPNVWFISAEEYDCHCNFHNTDDGNNLYNVHFQDEADKWKPLEEKFVFKLKFESTLFKRRYGVWRKVPLVESIYYRDDSTVLGLVDICTNTLLESCLKAPIPGHSSVVVPCYLCVDDIHNRPTDSLLSPASLEDRSTDEKNLRHMMMYHWMCDYCEYDCLKHNNWFPNMEMLKEHHLRDHINKMGDTESHDYDEHVIKNNWCESWRDKYEKYQNDMINGDISNESYQFLVREKIPVKQAFMNLPLSRDRVTEPTTTQACHICKENISRETTLDDPASQVREYLRHLLSKHRMCFFCACFHDRHNNWFMSEREYTEHYKEHIAHTPQSDIDWKHMEREFIHQLKIVSTLFRRRYGGWRIVPLESSVSYSDDPDNPKMLFFAKNLPTKRFEFKHPYYIHAEKFMNKLVEKKLIPPIPSIHDEDYDFDRDPF